MNKEELISFLKENLKVDIIEMPYTGPYMRRFKAVLKLGDETISESDRYVEVR